MGMTLDESGNADETFEQGGLMWMVSKREVPYTIGSYKIKVEYVEQNGDSGFRIHRAGQAESCG